MSGSHFNKLLFGTPEEVLHILGHIGCDETEVNATLTNAFKRIQMIEKRLERLEEELCKGT